MEDTMEMPQVYLDLVGTKQKLGGGLFSHKKDVDFQEYDVLDWRWGSGKIIDRKTLKFLHPTVEFLIKRKEMKRSRWTKGFAVSEIKLDQDD